MTKRKQVRRTARVIALQTVADTLRWSATAYYVSFGPHGPREPILPEGAGMRIVGGIVAAIGVAVAIFAGVRSMGQYFIR